jgi:UDP-4-amino-4,6-dideoxy-N-acetyl-beta-L-altrosamine transaminase
MGKGIPYGKQFVTEEDVRAVTDVLRGDFLTQGPNVEKFEREFASYVGCNHALAVANGTAALHLGAIALGVGEKSRVITTPITFAASANCVRYCGGEVYFADIDPITFLIDLNKVESLLKSKPKGYFTGLIPVDFAGRAVNMQETRFLADRYGLWIMEDACHAPGGYFVSNSGEKQHCGNCKYSDLTVFSFHPVKHIACGEGGMITTNSEVLFKKLSLLRTHGITRDRNELQGDDGGWYYEMQMLGYNYRLTDFQAALGASQLSRAAKGLQRRIEIAQNYVHGFEDNRAIISHSGNVEGHAYHLFVILSEKRKALYDHLRKNNIFSQVHYIPVHMMPYYRSLGWKRGDFPIAERYYDQCLSLPMYASLSDEEQRFVIDCVNKFLNE